MDFSNRMSQDHCPLRQLHLPLPLLRLLLLHLLLLLWLAPGSTTGATGPLHGLHSGELMPGEGQLVVPRRVHSDGVFMTHSLAYTHGRDHRRHRQRRSLLGHDVDQDQDQEPAELHLQLPLANETLHLELV